MTQIMVEQQHKKQEHELIIKCQLIKNKIKKLNIFGIY